MKVKIFCALNFEMCINTEFKNTLANYTKSDILRKKSMLQPADWEKNDLLFNKQLHVLNNIICYPRQEPLYIYIYYIYK